MQQYWDNYIKTKFSSNSKFYNLEITKLIKFKDSNTHTKFIGYGPNDDYILNIVKVTNNNINFIGMGKGESIYEAYPDAYFYLNTTSSVEDIKLLKIISKTFNWKIKEYQNICD